jgi:hypothetical protein
MGRSRKGTGQTANVLKNYNSASNTSTDTVTTTDLTHDTYAPSTESSTTTQTTPAEQPADNSINSVNPENGRTAVTNPPSSAQATHTSQQSAFPLPPSNSQKNSPKLIACMSIAALGVGAAAFTAGFMHFALPLAMALAAAALAFAVTLGLGYATYRLFQHCGTNRQNSQKSRNQIKA